MKNILFIVVAGIILCSCSIRPSLIDKNSNKILENVNSTINLSEQADNSENISQKIDLCILTLNDPETPGKDERQLNMLKCFKNLSKQGFPPNICKSLKRDNLIGCLGGFAKGLNDLSVCDLTSGVARDDCLEVQEIDF